MANVFAPFVAAAGNPPYAAKLKTADIEDGRKTSQFKKYRNLKLLGSPLFLPINSFACRYSDGSREYLCVSNQHLDADGNEALQQWASDEGFIEETLDEATFLFLCTDLSGYYRPLGINLKQSRADNLLDLFGEDGKADYNGHAIGDTIKWYQSVCIFEIPEDNRSITENLYAIAARLSGAHNEYRSAILPQDTALVIAKLSELSNVNPENIYYALTSSHWKQIFIDIYKCLEAVFYLPWTSALRSAISHPSSSLSLAKQCKISLHWREQEKASIEALFSMLDASLYKPTSISSIECFRDIYGAEDVKASSFGRRIYALRNQIVHQEDYEETTQWTIPDNAWPTIVTYVANIVHNIYYTHSIDIDYQYAA